MSRELYTIAHGATVDIQKYNVATEAWDTIQANRPYLQTLVEYQGNLIALEQATTTLEIYSWDGTTYTLEHSVVGFGSSSFRFFLTAMVVGELLLVVTQAGSALECVTINPDFTTRDNWISDGDDLFVEEHTQFAFHRGNLYGMGDFDAAGAYQNTPAVVRYNREVPGPIWKSGTIITPDTWSDKSTRSGRWDTGPYTRNPGFNGLLDYYGELYALFGSQVWKYSGSGTAWTLEADIAYQPIGEQTSEAPGGADLQVTPWSGVSTGAYSWSDLYVTIHGGTRDGEAYYVSSESGGAFTLTPTPSPAIPSGETVRLNSVADGEITTMAHIDATTNIGAKGLFIKDDKLYAWLGSGKQVINGYVLDMPGGSWTEWTSRPWIDGLATTQPLNGNVRIAPCRQTPLSNGTLAAIAMKNGESSMRPFLSNASDVWTEKTPSLTNAEDWSYQMPIVCVEPGSPQSDPQSHEEFVIDDVTGEVTIEHEVYNGPIDVEFEYSTDAPGSDRTWAACTDAGGASDGKTALATGTRTFVWDALTDLGAGPQTIQNVALRSRIPNEG